ncbi:MAG TPA: hypothetical protein DDY32_08515 [Desulfobulbaceae bacterium]|nr:hypothetical protein [Desulfobulbaceae bacterium]
MIIRNNFYIFINSILKLLALFFPIFIISWIIFTGDYKFILSNEKLFSFVPFLLFLFTSFFLFNYNFWLGFFYKKNKNDREFDYLKGRRERKLLRMKNEIEMEKKHYELEIERLMIKSQFIERKKEFDHHIEE